MLPKDPDLIPKELPPPKVVVRIVNHIDNFVVLSHKT